MGACGKISLAVFVVVAALSYQAYRDLSKPLERPEIGEQKIRMEFLLLINKLGF